VRITGVVDNNVWPPRLGVTVRTWNLYRGLARQAGVDRVTVVSALKSRERAPRAETREGVRIVRVKPWHPTLFAWLERAGLAPLSLAAVGHRLAPGLVTHAFDAEADVLEVDSLNLTPLLAHAPRGALKVYGAQNVEAEWAAQVGGPVASRPRWVRQVEDLERRALEVADLVVAVSAADRAQFVSRYGASPEKIAVVDNGFAADELRAPTAEEKCSARAAIGLAPGERGLLFVGSDFVHNRAAVDALLAQVGPALASLAARLFVVGGVGARYAARARAEGSGRVRALPEQADLTPWLWGADVGLNPMTMGAGSNVKLTTYLAAGLDVVTTRFGLRGFERLAPFVRQAAVEDFASALALPAPARTGRDAALAHYAWDALAARLHAAYVARRAGESVPA
jgi:glycosyltransferase involved in cell wall biosynthesis